MRLIDLQVRQFGCVAAADVTFGPDLNVLYGPNDLGKSSLGVAIRYALLLPAHSKEGERYASWHSDAAPDVVLTFEADESHFYRVSKTFTPRGGSAQLEFSRDRRSWSVEARGRDVDGELRRLLRWGIPEPGGKGRTRGVPQSYLATALLAPQDDVAGLLARDLEDDRELSGKERIAEALEALGEDPEVVQVREAIQARVAEAFTATGRKKSGQDSPFARMRDEIREAQQEVTRAQEELTQSLAVHSEVQSLGDELMLSRAEQAALTAELAKLEEVLGLQERLNSALAGVKTAEERVANIENELATVEEMQVAERRAMADQYELEKSLQERMRAREEAADARAAAQRQLDAAVAETDGLTARRREALTARIAQTEAAEEAARQRMRRAQEAGEKAAEVDRLEAELTVIESELGELVEADSGDQVAALKRELEILDGLARWSALEKARDGLTRATRAQSDHDHWLEEAAGLKSRAQKIEREWAERPLPDRAFLADLRALREKLRLAEARLDVGLSVTVTPRQPFALEVSHDGEPGPTQLLSEPIRLESQRRLELSLGALADLTIEGGDPGARTEAETLQARWERSALPRFEQAGVESLEALEARVEAAAQAAQEATALRQEASRALERARELGDIDEAVSRARAHVAAAEQALTGFDRPLLEERAAELGDEPEAAIATRRREVEASVAEADSKGRAREVDRAKLEARRDSLRDQLGAARTERDRRLSGLDEGWQAEQAAASRLVDTACGERETARAELASLETGEGDAAAEARSALERAQGALLEASSAEDAARLERETAQQLVATLRGQLGERRRRAESLDLEGARSALEEARETLARIPPPGSPVDAGEVAALRERWRQAEAQLDDLEARRHRAAGALSQAGGAGADEHLRDAEEALAHAVERERDLEESYESWRLLLEVLSEVERDEANHLGRSLVGPVIEQFEALTAGRYRRIAMGTGLTTDGVVVGGEAREPDALSVGTREQLATLVRLALAKQLGSVLVLDDQLVQSDRGRARYVSGLLREAGVQVIVLTARPLDYLTSDPATSSDGEAARDIDGARAIDLARVIERFE